MKKNKDITFLGNPAQLPYGVVIIEKNKITNFKRDIIFNSVKKNEKKKFYRICLLGNFNYKQKNYEFIISELQNFEKDFYPKIIKKFKCDFNHIKGTWFSIDNQKDIQSLNEKRSTNTKK